MHQHGRKYFACRLPPTLTLGWGSKSQNSTLSERGHAAYQIKGHHEFSNMVETILHADPPPTRFLGYGVTRSTFTFSEHVHVAYQI